MLSFGKYKGKLFEEVMRLDVKYCHWVLSQKETKHQNMLAFQNYVLTNMDTQIPREEMNCSKLSVYYEKNVEMLSYINSLTIVKDYWYINTTFNDLGLPPNMLGIFMDYLIRYKISEKIKQPFKDNRCERILSQANMGLEKEDLEEIMNERKINTVKEREHILTILQNNLKNITFPKKYQTEWWEPLQCAIEKGLYGRTTDDMWWINIIYDSYTKLKNLKGTLNDVMNVSISHSVLFGEFESVNYIDYFLHNAFEINIDTVNEYIQSKLGEGNQIQLNPTLGINRLKIGADADLIVDDELIDIKTSKYEIGGQISDFVQLFIYICLYYEHTGIKCKKISIFNPIIGTEYGIDLKEWDKFNEIVALLEKRIQ